MGAQATMRRTFRMTVAGMAVLLALTAGGCERDDRASDRSEEGIGQAIKKIRKSSSGAFERTAEQTRKLTQPRR
jgi:hypothetical protein